MLSALKQEILNKKRKLEENKLISDDRKYFKRSDLEEALYSSTTESPNINSSKSSSRLSSNDNNFNSSSNGDVDDAPTLPRAEVIKRLRDREEPTLLFGEEEVDAFKRLRKLEILEPEINRGLRNDFQEALERVDKAYLNEILANTEEQGSSKDTTTHPDEEFTLEDLQDLAKDLGKENNYEISCKIIHNFIQLILQMWKSKMSSRNEAEKMSVRGKMDSATFTQTNCYLKPLMKRLKTRSLSENILEYLTDIVTFCLERDYVKANDVYLQMAIGNAPWPIGVTMVGIHARTGREKIFSKHVAHVLNDETQRKYIQGVKRLITKCQSYFTANPSKCVEYQATQQT